jgi:hypothetical protein
MTILNNEGLKFGCKGKGEQGKIRNTIALIPKNVLSSSDISIFAPSRPFYAANTDHYPLPGKRVHPG